MQTKAACEEQRDVYWNYDTCACEKRGVVARGAGEEPRTNSNCGEYARWASGAHRVASLLDIGGWILLGSCLALVAILAAATYHYRCHHSSGPAPKLYFYSVFDALMNF